MFVSKLQIIRGQKVTKLNQECVFKQKRKHMAESYTSIGLHRGSIPLSILNY